MWSAFVWGIVAMFLASATFQQTHHDGKRPATLNLVGEEVTLRPEGWVPYALAKVDFFQDWCKRDDEVPCKILDLGPDQKRDFEAEWKDRRQIALADIQKPSWSLPSYTDRLDLRDADLSSAFLTGAKLDRANMTGANLSGAQLEGAVLSEAQMEGADLSFAQMEGAVLSLAQMDRADLWRAQMEGAVLRRAQMEGADLSFAQMEGAVLSLAQMDRADLWRAQMEGAVLSFSLLTGRSDFSQVLQSTNLNAVINNGGALRFVDLETVVFDAETDFRNVFFDGTVSLPSEFRAQMGDLCQEVAAELSDEEFFARWRGWLEHPSNPDRIFWHIIAPEGFENVEAIPPDDPNCTWKTDPIGQ